jgi:REP-associated tyrosine transposase
MSQSFIQIYLHIVFSTKHREPFLHDPNLREQLRAYLGGICRSLESPALSIGGVEDHVHLLCRQARGITVSDLVRDIKRASSINIKKNAPALSTFHWQSGFGVFSLSPTHVESLVKYIDDQEEHHRHVSYQEEFRILCRKYGVELDERYAWE